MNSPQKENFVVVRQTPVYRPLVIVPSQPSPQVIVTQQQPLSGQVTVQQTSQGFSWMSILLLLLIIILILSLTGVGIYYSPYYYSDTDVVIVE